MPWEAAIVVFFVGIFIGWGEERFRRRRRFIRQCAWCNRITDSLGYKVSHGICRGCEFKQKQSQN